MRPLVLVMATLAGIFASTFVIGRAAGILTADNVRLWLEQVHQTNAAWVMAAVTVLLFADLLVAVPTLTITLLSGYFLGFGLGASTAFAGISAAAFAGYGLCRRWGHHGIALIVRDARQRRALEASFRARGPAMILLCRAAPILPEVTACMAGATRMPFVHFAALFTIGTLPYVLIAAYAGSVSSIDDPRPAIVHGDLPLRRAVDGLGRDSKTNRSGEPVMTRRDGKYRQPPPQRRISHRLLDGTDDRRQGVDGKGDLGKALEGDGQPERKIHRDLHVGRARNRRRRRVHGNGPRPRTGSASP